MFREIDLFGKPVLLNFNGKDKSKSTVGACFSLLFFGFVIWSACEVGQDIIVKANPKTIMYESYSGDPESMIISSDTFNFAFGVQHPSTFVHYINESIYTVKASIEQLKREVDENGTIHMIWRNIPLVTESCTKEHFGPDGPKFESIELDGLYCLNKSQPNLSQIRIQGTFESSIYESLKINIYECDPQTTKVECAPKEILNEMLEATWFGVYYTNLAIDPRNYHHPANTFRDSYYTSISNTYFKDLPLWLNHVKVKSDSGWLTKYDEVKSYIKPSYIRENINFQTKDIAGIMTLRLRVDKVTSHYERSYIKIQDIFAQTNGLATSGIIVMFVFIAPFSRIKFYESLINELFDVKGIDVDKKTEKKNKCLPRKIKKSLDVNNESSQNPNLTQEKKNFNVKNDLTKESIYQEAPSNFQSFTGYLVEEEKSIFKPAPDFPGFPAKRKSQTEILVNATNFRSNQKKRTYQGDKFMYASKPDIEPSSLLHIDKMIDINKKVAKSLLDSNSSSENPKVELGTPSFLREKPKMTTRPPQIKILDNYEPKNQIESIIALENLIINQSKLKKIHSSQLDLEADYKEDKNKVMPIELKTKKDQTPQGNAVKSDYISNEEVIKSKCEKLASHLSRDSADKINISFGEYLTSYIWKSKSLKKKFYLLEEGIRRIEERLDIFNVLKKFREVDKLKLLLLENEQLVLFDALPKPEISEKDNASNFEKEKSFSRFKETKFITEKRRNDLVAISYKNLNKKENKTIVDIKLLEVYEDLIGF